MKKMRKMTIGIVTVFVVTNVSLTSSVFASRICINRNIYDNVQIASLKEKSIEILKEESTDIINGELSESPSEEPKATPGENPSEEPSERPSEEPTMEPSESPGEEPTMEPSESPGEEPTMEPSESPGEEPTMEPSENPSGQPIEEPNEEPIQIPNREGKNGIYYAQVLNEGDPSGILLDGEFNDWASIDKINYGQNGMSQIAAYWYGDYFYLYVEEEDRQGNAMCFTWNTFFEWTSNHGTVYPIRAFVANWNTEPKTLNIENYNGAQGIGKKVGNAYIWEMRFPVSVLGNEVYEVYLRKFTQKDALITLEDQSGEHQKKEPEIPEIPGSGVITLDGYFEDWDKIFHRPITYGSWNGTGVHNGALYIDDDVAYVHITMNDQYGAQMPLNAMTLKINGSAGSVQFSANYRDENYQNKWSGKVYNMDQGISSGLAIFNDNYPQVYLGDAYFHVYTSDHSRGDEYEFAISLKTVSQLTGIPIESMTQFELHLPNIGNAIIASYGSSTNPYLYVGVCLASVGLGSIYYRRRKRVVA